MSAIVQGQVIPSRNIVIAKGKVESSEGRDRSLAWSGSSSSSGANSKAEGSSNSNSSSKTQIDINYIRNNSSISPQRTNGMINKDDLINSNPFAAASSGNGSGQGILSTTSENGSEDASRTADGDVKKQARRRKANRACSHCQKAHLTCDDSRPCERCVKKGLANTCTDGARKKAKYLLDEDEICEKKEWWKREKMYTKPIQSAVELKREKERNKSESQTSVEPTGSLIKSEPADYITPSDWTTPKLNHEQLSPNHALSFGNSTTIAPASLSESAPVLTALQEGGTGTPSAGHNSEADLYGPMSNFSPTSSSGLNHAFGSETTSLEYSILSSMLNGIDPAWLSGSPEGQGSENDLGRALNSESGTNGAFSHMGINGMPWRLTSDEISSSPWKESTRGLKNQNQVEPLHHMDPTISGGTNLVDGVAAYDALEVPSPQGTVSSIDYTPLTTTQTNGDAAAAAAAASVKLAQTLQNSMRAAAAATGKDKKPDAEWQARVSHIYSDQMKPFPYTQGYHFLIKYVTANLEKAEVLRIVRALAIFRPSLIALQMPLTEEDEVFVERCNQRTILEFEKLISFSGTPTVVWRRTCEVVVVGAEFSMLTQWSKEYLTGRYIYEFFDKPSTLEYWEKFALHAFENTAQSIMMQVALKTSNGNTVKCAACFSIKRDVFDLPSLIVGNFLPILS